MQKFSWLPVKDANLATLKRVLSVAPETESEAVAKFQKFCSDNGFDEYGLAAHINPLKLKAVLAGGHVEELFERLDAEEALRMDKKEPGLLMDHAPCLFRNSKTNRRCFVTQPYLPLYKSQSANAQEERRFWLEKLDSWAKDIMGVQCKVLYHGSWYFSDTILVVFYMDGDIIG